MIFRNIRNMTTARDVRLLIYFAEIARAGSLRAAGRRLGISTAALSEALSDLEQRTGVTLIRRTTRTMALTDAGLAVLPHAEETARAARAAMDAARRASGTPEGDVHITLPIELGVAWLPPLLTRFETACPGVRVHVHADDAVVPLAASGFDLALRTVFTLQPRRGTDTLALLRLDLVCAPRALGLAS